MTLFRPSGFTKEKCAVKRTLFLVLCLATWLGAAQLGFAQGDMKPVAVVSIAGYDALKTDLDVIGRLSGNPKLGRRARGDAEADDPGQGFGRPRYEAAAWHRLLFAAGERAESAADDRLWIRSRHRFERTDGRGKEQSPIGLGHQPPRRRLRDPNSRRPPLCGKQKGDWAVFSNIAGDLANVPANPLELLGDLSKDYDVAVRVLVKNIPEQLRQEGVSQLQSAADRNMPPLPGGRTHN